MVKILLERQVTWASPNTSEDELKKIFRMAGVTSSFYDETLNNRPLLEAIVGIQQLGKTKWKISSTPSFVLNDKEVISGNMSYEDFVEKLSAFSAW